jgi:hypothetical protein
VRRCVRARYVLHLLTNADVQERDGSWTVKEGDKKTPPTVAVSDDAEDSASSEAMEFVMVESTSLTTLDEPPVVIPLDLTKDEVIAEPVQTVQSQPAHGDASATVQEGHRKRYTIRNGKVISVPEPVKTDPIAVAEPPPSVNPVKEAEPPKTVQPARGGAPTLPEMSPQRKTNKPQIPVRPVTGDSDGWSTESETEVQVTPAEQTMETRIPELSSAPAVTAAVCPHSFFRL